MRRRKNFILIKILLLAKQNYFWGFNRLMKYLSNPKRRALYDATLPPEEKIILPYTHTISYSAVPIWSIWTSRKCSIVILELDAPLEARQSPAPPLNVCLVLDRSTSMQGEKMDIVKAAAIQVLRNLRPQDILSVVTFSDRAEVIIPAAYYQERTRLEAKIQMIQPSGATEIYQGLEAGAKEVMRSLDAKRVNHIILLTDGHTYGDEQQCLALASKLAERGIGISGMGIGKEWNDIFLDVLATRTGGSSAYIAQPQDIKRLLLEKFNALAQTYADESGFKPCIRSMEWNYPMRSACSRTRLPILLEIPLRLGTILQDASTQVLFEYIIQPKAVKSDLTDVLDGSLKVSIASQPLPVPPLRLRASCRFPRLPEAGAARRSIVQALSQVDVVSHAGTGQEGDRERSHGVCNTASENACIQSAIAGRAKPGSNNTAGSGSFTKAKCFISRRK